MEQLTSTALTANVSSSGHVEPVSLDSTGLVPAVVLSLCFLLGAPGNISVIILRSKWQHLSSLSQTMVLNLAVADLLCLLVLPLWIYSLLYSWVFGLVACKLLSYLEYCSIFSSLLTVTMLSVQRYLQVVYLQRCLGQRGQKRLLVFLWLLAMILSIPPLMAYRLTTDQQRTQCHSPYSQAPLVAVLLTELFVGFVSLFVVMFAYICIYRKVNHGPFFNNPHTTRLVTSIIVTFFVLWMPKHIINVLSVAAIYHHNEGLLKFCAESWNTVGALTFLNSCLNPALYAFASCNVCAMCQNTEQE